MATPFDEWLRQLTASGKGGFTLPAALRGRKYVYGFQAAADFTGATMRSEVRIAPDAPTRLVGDPATRSKPTLESEDIRGEALAILREAMDRNIGLRQIFNPEENEMGVKFDPNRLDTDLEQDPSRGLDLFSRHERIPPPRRALTGAVDQEKIRGHRLLVEVLPAIDKQGRHVVRFNLRHHPRHVGAEEENVR